MNRHSFKLALVQFNRTRLPAERMTARIEDHDGRATWMGNSHCSELIACASSTVRFIFIPSCFRDLWRHLELLLDLDNVLDGDVNTTSINF